MWDDKPFRAELEKIGEVEVRAILARGDGWASLENRKNVAHDWLCSKDAERAAVSAKQTLKIQLEALKASKLAPVLAALTAILIFIVTLHFSSAK